MNALTPEMSYGRQRCRQWFPLFTQQLRLRHLQQIFLYNVVPISNLSKFYFTLHISSMCSPFYTSDCVEQGYHLKWTNLDCKALDLSAISAFVIRIWNKKDGELDSVHLSWGINMSGLAYLGNKLLDIQPDYFIENTVILQTHGGFFTSHETFQNDLQKPLPFIDFLNIVSDEDGTSIYRHSKERQSKSEVKNSYHLKKLLKMHSLQINLKNTLADLHLMEEKIYSHGGMCGLDSSRENFEPETLKKADTKRSDNSLLTMNILNKMLNHQEKPTKAEIQKKNCIKKAIEVKKFRIRLLMQERDKKGTKVRHLVQKFSNLTDENEEKDSLTMNNYRQLNKDSEKLREWKIEELHLKENLHHILVQLHHRQKQLMGQLLDIYPIQYNSNQKYFIHDVYFPNSDAFNDCSEIYLPVALGYISHILLMCSSFLQVPLRYPIMYFGSRSHIVDHITSSLIERDRNFPLYTRGKDKMQFDYAVYLLNKNIAQLRWLCGQNTPNLRETLPNLLTFLQNKESKITFRSFFVNRNENVSLTSSTSSDVNKISSKFVPSSSQPSEAFKSAHKPFGSLSSKSDPVIDILRQECYMEKSNSPTRKANRLNQKSGHDNPGLSQILSVPEAFLNRQISTGDFRAYVAQRKFNERDVEHQETSKSEDIEQGTDIINSCNSLPITDDKQFVTRLKDDEILSTKMIKQSRRKSRSVGSFIEDGDNILGTMSCLEVGSDPLINISSNETNDASNEQGIAFNVEDSQNEFLQQWIKNGSVLASSDENFFHEENLHDSTKISKTKNNECTLSDRTNALLSKTSFNMVKPK